MNTAAQYLNLSESELLERILRFRLLRPVFQPLFNTDDCSIYGFEGLIRGPEGSPLHSPLELFAAAERHGLRNDFELLAARTIIGDFGPPQTAGLPVRQSELQCADRSGPAH